MSEHVKRIVEESVRFILMLSLIASSYLIIMGAGALWEDHQRAMNQPVKPVPEKSIEELRDAMRYHGTLYSWQDEEGVWWFNDKQGRVCKLFAYKERGKK